VRAELPARIGQTDAFRPPVSSSSHLSGWTELLVDGQPTRITAVMAGLSLVAETRVVGRHERRKR
jgi:hypothetical protein